MAYEEGGSGSFTIHLSATRPADLAPDANWLGLEPEPASASATESETETESVEEEANKENARVGKEKGKTKAVVESASPPAAKSTRSRASFGKRAGEKYRSVAKEDDEETRGKPRREPKRTFSFTPLEL